MSSRLVSFLLHSRSLNSKSSCKENLDVIKISNFCKLRYMQVTSLVKQIQKLRINILLQNKGDSYIPRSGWATLLTWSPFVPLHRFVPFVEPLLPAVFLAEISLLLKLILYIRSYGDILYT